MVVNIKWGDMKDLDCCCILGIHVSENRTLCNMTRWMGVTGDGIRPDVNHMG